MSTSETKTKSSIFLIVVSLICVGVIVYFLVDIFSSPSEVGRMKQLTKEVRTMESKVKQKEGEVGSLVNTYKQRIGINSPLPFENMSLSKAERDLLQQEIAKEKDVSLRSLLKEILKKKDQIAIMREHIADIERQLPKPHIAQKGESHYQIALAFLMDEQGLEKAQAEKILARTVLFDELAEGFKVWNFYTCNEYGTSVTQGNAAVSPGVFVRKAKKQLLDERDNAVVARNKLADDVKTLEGEKLETLAQLDLAQQEKENLEDSVSQLNNRVHSMHYRLDSRKNLKKAGILKSGFLKSTKLQDVGNDQFDRAMDLSKEYDLVISAQDLGVGQINGVELYPRFYKKGSSYKVFITPNKKHALLTLLEKEKFESERVVIAVR